MNVSFLNVIYISHKRKCSLYVSSVFYAIHTLNIQKSYSVSNELIKKWLESRSLQRTETIHHQHLTVSLRVANWVNVMFSEESWRRTSHSNSGGGGGGWCIYSETSPYESLVDINKILGFYDMKHFLTDWIFQGWTLISIKNHQVTRPPSLPPSMTRTRSHQIPLLGPSHKAPLPPAKLAGTQHISYWNAFLFFDWILQGYPMIEHKNIWFEWNSRPPPLPPEFGNLSILKLSILPKNENCKGCITWIKNLTL